MLFIKTRVSSRQLARPHTSRLAANRRANIDFYLFIHFVSLGAKEQLDLSRDSVSLLFSGDSHGKFTPK